LAAFTAAAQASADNRAGELYLAVELTRVKWQQQRKIGGVRLFRRRRNLSKPEHEKSTIINERVLTEMFMTSGSRNDAEKKVLTGIRQSKKKKRVVYY